MISIRFRHFLLPAYFLPVYFLLVLVWIGGQTTPGLANEVDFEADRVEVNRDEGVIIATGNVILRQADETLYTDRLIYNEAADLAIAIGKVRLIQGDGGTTLSDRMELSEQFTRMIARPLISSFEDGTRFAAREGEAVQGNRRFTAMAAIRRANAIGTRENSLSGRYAPAALSMICSPAPSGMKICACIYLICHSSGCRYWPTRTGQSIAAPAFGPALQLFNRSRHRPVGALVSGIGADPGCGNRAGLVPASRKCCQNHLSGAVEQF